MDTEFNLKMWGNLAIHIVPDKKEAIKQLIKTDEKLAEEQKAVLTERTEDNRISAPWDF